MRTKLIAPLLAVAALSLSPAAAQAWDNQPQPPKPPCKKHPGPPKPPGPPDNRPPTPPGPPTPPPVDTTPTPPPPPTTVVVQTPPPPPVVVQAPPPPPVVVTKVVKAPVKKPKCERRFNKAGKLVIVCKRPKPKVTVRRGSGGAPVVAPPHFTG
jgi:hypothetical protein